MYALPRRPDCLENLQAIARDCREGGGEAYVCDATFLDRATEALLLERFQSERDAEYEALAEKLRAWKARAGSDREDASASLHAARSRFEEIARNDFFGTKRRAVVERLLARIDTQARSRPAATAAGDLFGRTWVTRRGIQVDRIACAWLVRRFVDARARFRFFDTRESSPREGEISFDLPGGHFTHEGDRCTFETLMARASPRDRALAEIAEVVHDIDLKDGKFGRPEAPGVELVLKGLILTNPDDRSRLARGMFLFDELYQSFRIRHRGVFKEARS